MNIERRVFKGTTWLSFFKAISQAISWLATILVARMLMPEDYGLMAMATIITGYAFIFSELGLGAAIVQRPSVTQKELSSVFWFAFGVSVLLAVFSFIAAYLTAYLFDNQAVVPLTKTTSIIFLIAGLRIVPLNLLKKELEFKTIGMIDMMGTITSCVAMVIFAYIGLGVWTLIIGNIVRGLTKLILIYYKIKWRPSFHFHLIEIKSFVKFGIYVALGNSLHYFYTKSDKFISGKYLGSVDLGFYSLAQNLASLPTEKIVVIINQVSFPAFAKLQDDEKRFAKFYFNVIKFTGVIVFPLFFFGFILGDELVYLALSDKWISLVPLFKYFCLVQIITSLNAINNFVHTARGNPNYSLYFNAWMALSMPVSFALAVQYGLYALLVPWLTVYILSCLFWIKWTVNSLGESMFSYMRQLFHPAVATIIMSFFLMMMDGLLANQAAVFVEMVVVLLVKVVFGLMVYCGYLYFFDKKIFLQMKSMVTSR